MFDCGNFEREPLISNNPVSDRAFIKYVIVYFDMNSRNMHAAISFLLSYINMPKGEQLNFNRAQALLLERD
jgi:hypothetical protein